MRWLIFEGIDGSGKSTLAHWLYKECLRVFPSVMHVTETGIDSRGLLSDRFRSQLVRRAVASSDPYCSMVYFLASRVSMNVSYPFHDNYDDELVVVRDRCFISTYVYQGMRLVDDLFAGLDASIADEFLFRFCLRSEPVSSSDRVLCFLLDVDPEVAWRRISGLAVGDCYDRSLDEMRLTRERYLSFIDRFSGCLSGWDFCVLDASLDLSVLMDRVQAVAMNWLRGDGSHGVSGSFGEITLLQGAS